MTLLALTSTEDGRMLVDPVPLLPRSDRDVFAYGGGTPATTYRALLRCALGDVPGVTGISTLDFRGPDGTSTSQLWTAISTTKGPGERNLVTGEAADQANSLTPPGAANLARPWENARTSVAASPTAASLRST